LRSRSCISIAAGCLNAISQEKLRRKRLVKIEDVNACLVHRPWISCAKGKEQTDVELHFTLADTESGAVQEKLAIRQFFGPGS
jgi:hypothetical protein